MYLTSSLQYLNWSGHIEMPMPSLLCDWVKRGRDAFTVFGVRFLFSSLPASVVVDDSLLPSFVMA